MADKTKLNGGVDALAKAMRQVFTEALDATAQPLKESMDGLRTDMSGLRTDMDGMEGRLNKRIDAGYKYTDTTNKNMSAQFAEQEKKIGKLIKDNAATT